MGMQFQLTKDDKPCHTPMKGKCKKLAVWLLKNQLNITKIFVGWSPFYDPSY